MCVLVTGAFGFVGINVVRHLAMTGRKVVASFRTPPDDIAKRFLEEFRDHVVFAQADVQDSEALNLLVRDLRVQEIVHAAAMTPTLETERSSPGRVMQINLMGTVNVLDAARENRVRRVVYVSSDGLYGPIADVTQPVKEDQFPLAENLYGVSKIASEAVCRRYQSLFGIEIASGRVCSTYGPMERATGSRFGMSAVFAAAHAILEGRVLAVRGLEVCRTWTHVEDIARAVVAMLQVEKFAHSAYNLSYGKPYSLLEVLETFQRIEPSFSYDVVDEGDAADVSYDLSQQRGPLDVTRLRNDLGYRPRFDLESGIHSYLTWLRSGFEN